MLPKTPALSEATEVSGHQAKSRDQRVALPLCLSGPALPKDWVAAHKLSETYHFTPPADQVDEAKRLLGLAATSVIEATLSEIMSSDMSTEQQKKKIDKHLKKLPQYAKPYGIDVKKQVFPRIISDAVAQLIS